MSNNTHKKQAAERAVEFIESGMIVGLGHGSTAMFALHKIAELIKAGSLNQILGIPCSNEIEKEAQTLNVPLTTLGEHPQIDITIDGADEVDPNLNLIKGGGGALLREKIVANATTREIIVIDESKLSPVLGTNHALPVEVTQFGWETQVSFIKSLGAECNLRMGQENIAFITDSGNYLLDCDFGPIENLNSLAEKLERRTGVIEHGLFLGLTTDVIAAGEAGLTHLKPN